jgi:tripartite-type tricarboxylate transporter receptor subunit TctC
VVIPLGAGGSHDLHARGITSILGDILGQPVVVSLVPGGAGMKGTSQVAKATPDGYTIIFTHNAFDQLTPQTRKVDFDPLTAFKSIARINASEPMLAARAGVPYKTHSPNWSTTPRRTPARSTSATPASGAWASSRPCSSSRRRASR